MSLTGGEQKWRFLHARDAAAAFRTVLVHPRRARPIRCRPSDAPLLRATPTQICDLINPSAELGFGDIPIGLIR
jgi:hypothetical protein